LLDDRQFDAQNAFKRRKKELLVPEAYLAIVALILAIVLF